MPGFARQQYRLVCLGVCLNAPQDACPQGKYPVLQNMRSYQQGTLQPRLGLTPLTNGAINQGAIHTLGRLNDSTPFAASAFWRFVGAGVKIFAGNPTLPQIDTGYSGNPLVTAIVAPVQAPNPYVYVADSSRNRKFDVNGHVFPMGTPQPSAPTTVPTVSLGYLNLSIINDFPVLPTWNQAGTGTVPILGPFRVDTLVNTIIYDSGNTGNASIIPASMAGFDENCLVNIFTGLNSEEVQVLQICLPIVTTTIGAIIYDAGNTGACTIQPTASLGTGQLDSPLFGVYDARAGGYGQTANVQAIAAAQQALSAAVAGLGNPSSGAYGSVLQSLQGQIQQQIQAPGGNIPAIDVGTMSSARMRQIDFPVNCLITIAGAETVRVLSVTVDQSGIQGFRCVTTGTRSPGDSLVGVASIRVNTLTTRTAGMTISDVSLENTVTAPVGGIQTAPGWTPQNNLGQIGLRPTTGDDDLHLSVRLSDCTVVDAIRVYIDVDATVNDFTQNYYFAEFRSNDILAAIQSSNAASVSTLQDVRQTTVANAQLNQGIDIQNAPNSTADYVTTTTGAAQAADAEATPLSVGNNQWLDLHCKVSAFQRVGTDPSRSLANAAAAEILVYTSSAVGITVDYDAVWLSGGFGPDVGSASVPYVYCYRWRSSTTGVRSNPSPASPAGVMPHRQAVNVTATISPDAQMDLVDWFRIGGALPKMTYVGTVPNAGPFTLADITPDSAIINGEILSYDYFQPWATTDKARLGGGNVAGNALARTSGDNFNTSWAPGTPIIIGGTTFTLRTSPPTANLLFTNENIGQGSVNWYMPIPTLLSQPLSAHWGPYADGTLFACGDPNNPGALYWSFPYDADRTSDANVVIVTSGSEKLLNGFMWDQVPFVWSTDNLYAIGPAPNGNGFQGQITPCGKGLWNPWGFCVSPRGTYFIMKDGIGLTQGGSPAQSITDADLYPIFPHDGNPGVAVNGFNPPDMTQTTRLRLSYVDGWVYFDYLDTQAAGRTLAYREADGSWWPDVSNPVVTMRCNEMGAQVHEELIGGADGTVYLPGTAFDNGNAFTWKAQFTWDAGDARAQKLYRDFMVDADLTQSQALVALATNNNVTAVASQTLVGATGRQEYFTNILPALGAFGQNLTIVLSGSPVITTAPILYVADVASRVCSELASSWLSGPTTHGGRGWQNVAAALIAYVSTQALQYSLIIDGVEYTYVLPNSNGAYTKQFIWLKAIKGLGFQHGLQSAAGFIHFAEDDELWVQLFGRGGYEIVKPF